MSAATGAGAAPGARITPGAGAVGTMNRVALSVVVSLSGASVLVLEILGTRVLGPFYGVSLFLWSALIAVTLAALAAGYALGGRWALRDPSAGRLALVLAFAGLWVLAIPWLRGPVVHVAAGFGLRTAVLSAAMLLFFPPLALLGMVSPYAIRLATRSVDEVGRVAGDLFAISTLASVAAAVATGFLLIPTLGVNRLLVAVAIALFAAAAVAGGAGRAAFLPGAGIVLALLSFGRADHIPPGVLARLDSPYSELRVVDAKGFRYLLIDGGTHTVVNAETGFPRQPYVFAAEIATDLSPPHGRMLLLGLGGGSAARTYADHGWQVDAVEIDPDVPRLATGFFRLAPHHAHVIVAEARQFLQQTHQTWDVIFFDAFGSASIPFHLVTREAFALAKARLNPGGIVVVNIETVGWQDPLAHALVATLRTQFRDVFALPTAEPPDQLGNVVLMASDRTLDLKPELLGDPVGSLSDEDEHFRVIARLHAWNNRYQPGRGKVLTDDWNPADLRAEEINRAARIKLREQLPDSLTAD
jgi:spermidine synthase